MLHHALPLLPLLDCISGLRLLAGALLLLLLALHPTRATSHLLPSRCSACLAVSGELQDRLDHEKPRNHLGGLGCWKNGPGHIPAAVQQTQDRI